MAIDWYEIGRQRFYGRTSIYPTQDKFTPADEARMAEGFHAARIERDLRLITPPIDE